MITTANDAIDAMLAMYAEPDAPDMEAALYRVIGDPEEPGITEAEWRRRETLVSAVFQACGVDLCQLADAARDRRPVVAVLRGGLDHAGAPSRPHHAAVTRCS